VAANQEIKGPASGATNLKRARRNGEALVGDRIQLGRLGRPRLRKRSLATAERPDSQRAPALLAWAEALRRPRERPHLGEDHRLVWLSDRRATAGSILLKLAAVGVAQLSYPRAYRLPRSSGGFCRLHANPLDRLCPFFRCNPGELLRLTPAKSGRPLLQNQRSNGTQRCRQAGQAAIGLAPAIGVRGCPLCPHAGHGPGTRGCQGLVQPHP
jgi:hypothetical protein